MNEAIVKHIRNLEVPAILDVEGEWCFIRNPKAATHTIAARLEDRGVVHGKRPQKWETMWKEMFEHRMDEVVLFTFVRNPWDRVLSAFMFCHQLRPSKHDYYIDEHWTFRKWIMDVLRVQGPSANLHFVEQVHSFMHDGLMIPDIFIGRFERLKEDWRILANCVGLPNTIPKRLNTSRHEHYTNYYDSETKDVVRRVYRAEIEALGYEYEEG